MDGSEDAMCHKYNSCICGKRIQLPDENRIVDGSDARLGEYPWMVYIIVDYEYWLTGGYECGGTLITNKGRVHLLSLIPDCNYIPPP